MPRIDVAEPPEVRVSVELLRVVLGPEGEIDVERLIVPLNPFRLVTVIVELSVEDRERLKDDGSAEMEKSGFTGTISLSTSISPSGPRTTLSSSTRSEERRVGKEWKSR